VESPCAGTVKAGESVKVFATVELGSIPVDNVRVELYFGSLDAFGNIQDARMHEMALSTNIGSGVFQFVGAISAGACGQQGYAVRVLPNHPNIALRFEPGLVRWG
jgi:starch phosphorylase